MNIANNALVVSCISSEREFNELVVYGSEEDVIQERHTTEQQLTALTSGETRTLGHVVEALRSRLVILNNTLSLML